LNRNVSTLPIKCVTYQNIKEIEQIPNYKHQIPNKSQIPISNDQNTRSSSEGDGDFVLGSAIESQFTALNYFCLDKLGVIWIISRLIFCPPKAEEFICYLCFVICDLRSFKAHDNITSALDE